MKYFLRYSLNIDKDLERGISYHYTGLDKTFSIEEIENGTGLSIDELEYNEEADMYVQPLSGLCAFELEAETIEEAIEEARGFRFNDVYNTEAMYYFHILTGDYEDECPEGCVISNAELVYSNN
jgi:hypothetical protein